jgi:hypothetical protein
MILVERFLGGTAFSNKSKYIHVAKFSTVELAEQFILMYRASHPRERLRIVKEIRSEWDTL